MKHVHRFLAVAALVMLAACAPAAEHARSSHAVDRGTTLMVQNDNWSDVIVYLMRGSARMAISWGVKRGIYSNEAGQGTAPHAAAAAETSHPVKQGLVQAFSVYVDTLLVCTATAFMILFTGKYNVVNPAGGFLVENLPGVGIGSEYTQQAVNAHFPALGGGFVAVALFLFAFTTIMAYYYIAETNLRYLNTRHNYKWMIGLLRVFILVTTFYGSIKTAESAWVLGDIGVGLMAWLNVVAILLLRKPALRALKDYQAQKKAGRDPVFEPAKLGIRHAEEWQQEERQHVKAGG